MIEGKRGLDAFGSTNLDFILRSKGITTVVLAGFLTNCCVESTMRSAYEKGFEVITLTDAVGATSHGRARERDQVRLPDVLQADHGRRVHRGAPGRRGRRDTSRGY